MARVRLFAALREMAGSSVVEVEDADAGTPAQIVRALSERYGERFAGIANAGSVVVNGERATLDMPLTGSEEVALLPPVSGG